MRGRDSFIGQALAAAFTAPSPSAVDGFVMKRGLEDAVEAAVDFRGPQKGRFVVAMPRMLLARLFGGLRGAENELAAAFGMLALYACSQVLRAKHDTASGVVFSEPELGPARAATDGEVVIPIGGSWLAANLLDADAIGGVS